MSDLFFWHSFWTGFHLSARKVREKINLCWGKVHRVKYLHCISPFVITTLPFSRAVSNVFCYKCVLIGFVYVYAKNRNRGTNCFICPLSCLWRISVDWRITNIQDRYPSLPQWLWLMASESSCKMRLFPPLVRQLNLDMSTGSMSLEISMHLVRLKQLPLDFQRVLEVLHFFPP